jgi:hypothetical protein
MTSPSSDAIPGTNGEWLIRLFVVAQKLIWHIIKPSLRPESFRVFEIGGRVVSGVLIDTN